MNSDDEKMVIGIRNLDEYLAKLLTDMPTMEELERRRIRTFVCEYLVIQNKFSKKLNSSGKMIDKYY